MTALMPEWPVLDKAAIAADLRAVLDAHGITGATVTVSEIEQGGAFAGVTVSAYTYERPAHLPPADQCARPDRSPFADLADELADRYELDPPRPALRVVKGGAE